MLNRLDPIAVTTPYGSSRTLQVYRFRSTPTTLVDVHFLSLFPGTLLRLWSSPSEDFSSSSSSSSFGAQTGKDDPSFPKREWSSLQESTGGRLVT